MMHEEKMTLRIPKKIKRRVRVEARAKFVSEADVVRAAILEFFTKQDEVKAEKVAA